MSRIKQIQKYYHTKLKQETEDYRCLGWESEEAQRLRFHVLNSVIFPGASILDVGCGLGDLYEYLKERGNTFSYTGVDILPEMISKAKKRFRGVEFIRKNIFKGSFPDKRSFDIVFASGIFNIELNDDWAFLEHAILSFSFMAKKFIVFNLLHSRSATKESGYSYKSPEDVKNLISEMLPSNVSVQIVDDYLDNDFTVILGDL